MWMCVCVHVCAPVHMRVSVVHVCACVCAEVFVCVCLCRGVCKGVRRHVCVQLALPHAAHASLCTRRAQALTNVTQQVPDHAEAWNNVAALWLELDEPKRAYSALGECLRCVLLLLRLCGRLVHERTISAHACTVVAHARHQGSRLACTDVCARQQPLISAPPAHARKMAHKAASASASCVQTNSSDWRGLKRILACGALHSCTQCEATEERGWTLCAPRPVLACRYKRDSWQIWENYAQVAQQAGYPLQATRALAQVRGGGVRVHAPPWLPPGQACC